MAEKGMYICQRCSAIRLGGQRITSRSKWWRETPDYPEHLCPGSRGLKWALAYFIRR